MNRHEKERLGPAGVKRVRTLGAVKKRAVTGAPQSGSRAPAFFDLGNLDQRILDEYEERVRRQLHSPMFITQTSLVRLAPEEED